VNASSSRAGGGPFSRLARDAPPEAGIDSRPIAAGGAVGPIVTGDSRAAVQRGQRLDAAAIVAPQRGQTMDGYRPKTWPIRM